MHGYNPTLCTAGTLPAIFLDWVGAGLKCASTCCYLRDCGGHATGTRTRTRFGSEHWANMAGRMGTGGCRGGREWDGGDDQRVKKRRGGWSRAYDIVGSYRCRRVGACIGQQYFEYGCVRDCDRRSARGQSTRGSRSSDRSAGGAAADAGVLLVSRTRLISRHTGWRCAVEDGCGGERRQHLCWCDDTGQQRRRVPVRQDALRCELGSAGPGVQSCAHPPMILSVRTLASGHAQGCCDLCSFVSCVC